MLRNQDVPGGACPVTPTRRLAMPRFHGRAKINWLPRNISRIKSGNLWTLGLCIAFVKRYLILNGDKTTANETGHATPATIQLIQLNGLDVAHEGDSVICAACNTMGKSNVADRVR
jgi:hypothetical protein